MKWSELGASFEETEGFDAIVGDLGLCTRQLEQRERGFSFKGSNSDPLDMRMSAAGPTGADLLNEMSQEELENMFMQLGQEPVLRAHAISQRIARERPITSVEQFARILRTEKQGLVPKHLDPATLGFQALRMTVNEEVNELITALDISAKMLRPGGVMAMVSYHSIEDRIVKKFLQISSGRKDPEHATFEECNEFIRADAEEIRENRRASSALLRFGIRTEAPFKSRLEQLQGLALKRRV
jgi:16S rRNA (cytosine1402-N4)-methyltransferase